MSYNTSLNYPPPEWRGTHKPANLMTSTVTTGTSAKVLRQYAATYGIDASANLRMMMHEKALVNKLNRVWALTTAQEEYAISNEYTGELKEAYLAAQVDDDITLEEAREMLHNDFARNWNETDSKELPVLNPEKAQGLLPVNYGLNSEYSPKVPRSTRRRAARFMKELARA